MHSNAEGEKKGEYESHTHTLARWLANTRYSTNCVSGCNANCNFSACFQSLAVRINTWNFISFHLTTVWFIACFSPIDLFDSLESFLLLRTVRALALSLCHSHFAVCVCAQPSGECDEIFLLRSLAHSCFVLYSVFGFFPFTTVLRRFSPVMLERHWSRCGDGQTERHS